MDKSKAARASRPALAPASAVTDERNSWGQGTVFVVDDEEPMRNALRRLLASAGFAVETFESAADFLERGSGKRPGCILLDLHMPGISGLELQDQLRTRGVTLPVIFLTGAGNVAHAVRAMHSGAIDFIEKPFSNEALVERVGKALAADRAAVEHEANRAGIVEKVSSLTPREKEVLLLLSQGKSNKLIARTLDLSPRTVEGYRARITEKLEAKSVAELVKIVQECRHVLSDAGGQRPG